MAVALAAPSPSSPIPNTLNFSASVLFRGSLTFSMPPSTRGPASGCWPCLQVSWGRVSCVPSSFPWPALPGGASAVRTRSGRLSNAPRHLRPSEALSTGRGASHRRPTSAAASGASLPAALAPRRQGSAREVPRQHVLPARSGGLCGRPPASCARFQVPLLPGWESWLVRRCFQALLSTIGLQLPFLPLFPFLACDLASLV